MKKINLILPVILFLITGLYTANLYGNDNIKPLVSMTKHITNSVTCMDCHGTENPKTEASQAGCIKCHTNSDGTYRGELDKNGVGIEKEYKESGKTKMASIHDSHAGKIRCTVCHTAHKKPEKLYCNYCHQFDIQIK